MKLVRMKLLTIITEIDKEEKFTEVLNGFDIDNFILTRAYGTASPSILDYFGLLEVKKQIAIDYEQKALALLKKAQAGDLDSAEADRLATEALTKKQAALDEVQRLTGDLEKYSAMLKNMEAKILQLKTQIKNWEGELSTLKARATVAKTTKKINKQLARIDSNDTLSMLNDMKTKIQEEENLALAYEELTIQENGVDEEINKALGVRPEVAASLEDLKKSIGVNKQPELIEMQEKAPEVMTELEKMKKELEN